MLCQKCGVSEATVLRQTKVFRQTIQEHLCALCAGALEHAKPPVQFSVPVAPTSEVQSRGMLRSLAVSRPIIVRDLAIAMGLQPFKLISALNQLVGFAAMNSKLEDSVGRKIAGDFGFTLTIENG
jgi:hypothetical protein